jgi:hypothetical protein
MSQKYIGGFITKSPVAPTSSAASGMWTIDQAMQLQKQGLWPSPPPTTIGQPYGGGFYAGQIGVSGVATHYLIIGPVASAQNSSKTYKNAQTATTGADSVIDGPQNTADIVADGSSTVYPAAHFCNDLVIGGFSDWYLPALNELEVCYYNLKPTTSNNITSVGINPNAIPPRASNYTTGDPAQTSAAAFQNPSGAETLETGIYTWSSTEGSTTGAGMKFFANGQQLPDVVKNYAANVRAIRRIPV